MACVVVSGRPKSDITRDYYECVVKREITIDEMKDTAVIWEHNVRDGACGREIASALASCYGQRQWLRRQINGAGMLEKEGVPDDLSWQTRRLLWGWFLEHLCCCSLRATSISKYEIS